jgi:hypothetical protein
MTKRDRIMRDTLNAEWGAEYPRYEPFEVEPTTDDFQEEVRAELGSMSFLSSLATMQAYLEVYPTQDIDHEALLEFSNVVGRIAWRGIKP